MKFVTLIYIFSTSTRPPFSFDYVKRSFYRAANTIFGKVGRIALEEVILHLLTNKYIPVLLFGLDACTLTKSDLNTLDFTVKRFLMKLFKAVNTELINECRIMFGVKQPSELTAVIYKLQTTHSSNCRQTQNDCISSCVRVCVCVRTCLHVFFHLSNLFIFSYFDQKWWRKFHI
jgi:hypothetical protein